MISFQLKLWKILGLLLYINSVWIPTIKKSARHHFFIWRIFRTFAVFFSDKAAVQLTHAFVSSRLDYCNSLLQGLPSCSIRRLQSIQNIAARILTRTRKYKHITPILKNLHWLPVASRIDYKILLLTYCAINNISPAYIQQLITPYLPARKLRSENMCLLNVPSSRLQRFGGINKGVSVELLQWCGTIFQTIFGKQQIWWLLKITSKHTFLNCHLYKTIRLLYSYSTSNGPRFSRFTSFCYYYYYYKLAITSM